MENKVALGMNFKQFLRGRFNAHSEKAPTSLNEAIQNPNLPQRIKMFHGGTLKHRLNVLDAFEAQEGIQRIADESFSVEPITAEQEDQIEAYTRQFYESVGYKFDKKDTLGLTDTYFFRNDSGEAMVVTCTLPFDNESDGLLVSASKVRVR